AGGPWRSAEASAGAEVLGGVVGFAAMVLAATGFVAPDAAALCSLAAAWPALEPDGASLGAAALGAADLGAADLAAVAFAAAVLAGADLAAAGFVAAAVPGLRSAA
ncbi:MAG: hypothetical protein KDG44_06525, partial [Burkholderiaceae bacterium]|nr:hypothetical protein [Burkholderiaceae bacterium]